MQKDELRALLAVKDTRNYGALRCHEGDFSLIPGFLSTKKAQALFVTLMDDLPWKTEWVKMFGRPIETRREVAFFGTHPLCYGYAGTRHQAAPLPPELAGILTAVQNACHAPFNSILATRYPDGHAGLGWHRDNEAELGPAADIKIASLSLGSTRPFEIRDRVSQEIERFTLESGTLFIMDSGFQTRWQHRVPKAPAGTLPRINLSFRTLKPPALP